MVIIIKILQFLLALSILIFVHELGHFLAAKAFKTRVEKFYLFFDWGFSLFRCKKVNGKWCFKFFAKNVPEKYTVTEYKDAAGKKQKKYEPIDNLLFEQTGLLKGDKLLKFKDLELNEYFEVPNPLPGMVLPFPVDTRRAWARRCARPCWCP